MNKLIDHTALKATTTKEDIKKLCSEAIEHNFKSVCINPAYIKYAKELLVNSDVLVCTVIGFPLGANSSIVKGFETKQAIQDGADEVDMVINVSMALNKEFDLLEQDIKEVVNNANGKTVKVIIETCYLTNEEKIEVCKRAKNAKADFVKTSTGFGTGGAKASDIKLMKEAVNSELFIKASGGIKSFEELQEMVDNGATRIGTSSGISLLNKEKSNTDY